MGTVPSLKENTYQNLMNRFLQQGVKFLKFNYLKIFRRTRGRQSSVTDLAVNILSIERLPWLPPEFFRGV